MISSGALTESGREKVEEIMSNFGIRKRYLAEVLCILSLVFLAAVYSIHNYLPDYFYKQGHALYKNSDLTNAAFKFQQGLAVNPDDERFNLELGKVYESMGDLEKALEQYYLAAQTGDSWSLNNLGRVLLFRDQYVLSEPYVEKQPPLSESYLKMALQRALGRQEGQASTSKEDINDLNNLLYQIYRNLGWALLKQKEYDEALRYLVKAVKLDESIIENQIGGGMAYCLLSYTQQQMGQTDQADKNWQQCLIDARPETIFEYKWFIDIGRSHDAERIFTTSIVGGIDEEQFKNMLAKDKAESEEEPLGAETGEQQQE